MVFDSLGFAFFLLIVFSTYWLLFNRSAKSQNILLLSASSFFYAYADWRFLALLFLNIIINYFLGIKIADSKIVKTRQQFFWIGLAFNIGVLGVFKYFNFFYDSFANLLNLFGANIEYNGLKILLPLGISFFTFQTLGYLTDVYNEEINPSRDLLIFATYVSFFPKLLAGPIERAQKFIPQIEIKREFNYDLAVDGMRQILWGLFAKMVISNNCTYVADIIFNDFQTENGSTLLFGAFIYAFQLYADFSGYSNIAIGVSKLFGIRLMTNFSTPYFSTNISDFWKKWHISLSSWMMDYVHAPLSFILRKYKYMGSFLSIITTFLLVGFWHGAEWKYVVFGILNGIYFIPLILLKRPNRIPIVAKGKMLPSIKEFFQMLALFTLVTITMIFFRAENVGVAISYISGILSSSILSLPEFPDMKMGLLTFILILLFIIIEWLAREQQFAIAQVGLRYSKYTRWILYYIILFSIFIFAGSNQQFIYFQF